MKTEKGKLVTKMESKLNLENVTNGLLTVQKLKQIYRPAKRQEEGETSSYVQLDRLSLLQETLTAITSFLPESRGGSFSEAFKQGSRYSSAYRGIKQQVRDMDWSRLDSTQVLKGLKLVAPILSSKQRLYMDKVVKIFDMLQS